MVWLTINIYQRVLKYMLQTQIQCPSLKPLCLGPQFTITCWYHYVLSALKANHALCFIAIRPVSAYIHHKHLSKAKDKHTFIECVSPFPWSRNKILAKYSVDTILIMSKNHQPLCSENYQRLCLQVFHVQSTHHVYHCLASSRHWHICTTKLQDNTWGLTRNPKILAQEMKDMKTHTRDPKCWVISGS